MLQDIACKLILNIHLFISGRHTFRLNVTEYNFILVCESRDTNISHQQMYSIGKQIFSACLSIPQKIPKILSFIPSYLLEILVLPSDLYKYLFHKYLFNLLYVKYCGRPQIRNSGKFPHDPCPPRVHSLRKNRYRVHVVIHYKLQ